MMNYILKNDACLLLIWALMCIGCSPEASYTESYIESHIPTDERGIEVLWEKMDVVLSDNPDHPTLVSSDNIVLLEGRNRDEPGKFQVFAYQVDDGQFIWKIEAPFYASSVLKEKGVYFRGIVGRIQAFELLTGNLLWETKLPGARSVTDLYTYDDKIVAQTNNDNEYTLLAMNGQILQRTSIKNHSFFRIDDLVFIKKYNAIEAVEGSSGVVVWSVEVKGGIGFAPLFDSGHIYLVSKGVPNKIISVNEETGGVNWQRNDMAISNLCILGSKLYFLKTDGSLVGLDKENGEVALTIKFSPSVDYHAYPGRYYIACDASVNVLVVSFGDTDQVIGLRVADNPIWSKP